MAAGRETSEPSWVEVRHDGAGAYAIGMYTEEGTPE